MTAVSEAAVARAVGIEILLSSIPPLPIPAGRGDIVPVKWEIYCLAPDSDCGATEAECGIVVELGNAYI